jgi:hypothetical protein
MLKREITYEDFNGNSVTDTYYFNLTRTEMIELEVKYEGGLEAALQRIIETKDMKNLISEFQNIILAAYGLKMVRDLSKTIKFVKNSLRRQHMTHYSWNWPQKLMQLLISSRGSSQRIFLLKVLRTSSSKRQLRFSAL